MLGSGIAPASAESSKSDGEVRSSATSEPKVYIVQLREAPVATYRGGIAGLLQPEREALRPAKLDLDAPATQAYVEHLHALNAVVLRLSESEAAALAAHPAVLSIQREQMLKLHTHRGPTYIGAPTIWQGSTASGSNTVARASSSASSIPASTR